MTGTVVRALRDFVFILPDDRGCDVFARRSEFIDPPATFEPGMRVEFSAYKGPKGTCGEKVRVIEDDGQHLDHGFIESTKTDFAFIRPDDNGPSVFVHCAECDFDFPATPGLRCTYLLTTDRSGRSRAAVCRKEQS